MFRVHGLFASPPDRWADDRVASALVARRTLASARPQVSAHIRSLTTDRPPLLQAAICQRSYRPANGQVTCPECCEPFPVLSGTGPIAAW